MNLNVFTIIIGDMNINIIGDNSIDNDYFDTLSMWSYKPIYH